ncbi:MAG: hypothetical protein MOP51_2359 [Citricoccus sp.]|nr:hypothetical protein [Citricoccus sp. WCRC_4]
MQQHPPDTVGHVPTAPHPSVPADRVPGDPHPLARQGRDPARAKQQSLVYSVLAFVTLLVPPLPFLFGAWAVARASDAGKTGRPALGQVLGVIALVLSAAMWLTMAYMIPALIRFALTLEEFNPWLWWR